MLPIDLAIGAGAWSFATLFNGVFAGRLRLNKDAKILPKDERVLIENKINEIAAKFGVTKKLELIEIRGFKAGAQALGNSTFPGRAGIAITPELFHELNENEQEWVIAHEVSHIKNDDMLKMGIVSGIITLVTTAALSILFPPLAVFSTTLIATPALTIASLVGFVAFAIISRSMEKRADMDAMSISSKKVKLGAVEFFERFKANLIKNREEANIPLISKFFRKAMISSEGNVRWDILHPSITTRISYLKAYNHRLGLSPA